MGFAGWERLCGVNWEDVGVGSASVPTHDDETVMNGAPDSGDTMVPP
jgi:hypothetical protein